MARSKQFDTDKQIKDKLLPRLSLFFFKRSRTTALIWLMIALFGALSYTTLLKREGFPSISIPLVVVSGSSTTANPADVDTRIAKPVSDVALKQSGVSSVQTTSQAGFFSAIVQYDESVDVNQAKNQLKSAVEKANLPADAKLSYNAPYFGVTGGMSDGKVDATVSFYRQDNSASLSELTATANQAIEYLNKQDGSQIDKFFLQNPYRQGVDPTTGAAGQVQRSFDSFANRQNNQTNFYQSVVINVAGIKGADVIELDKQINAALDKLASQKEFAGYSAAISASNGPTITQSISELQKSLLEGLLAVLVICALLIALRASLLTVLSMLTVIAATVGLLFLLGYSLNVITLFAIILGLSLIVDDTIIMVEALDASRKKSKTALEAVTMATRKISRAMVAATLTAALSFTPLLFVGGILGSFIRAIPVTIISALLISLLVALIFIPLFAKFLLLGRKQLGNDGVKEYAANFEHRIAQVLAKPMLWAQHSRPKEFFTGIVAIVIGLGFVAAAGFIFTKVTFNIFPPTKDTNQIAVSVDFPPTTTVPQAAEITRNDIDKRIATALGDNFVDASYYGLASNQNATLFINIKPYTERKPTATELAQKVEDSFKGYNQARVTAYQLDIGPPAAPFVINIQANDRAKAEKLASDLAVYLQGRELTRPSGEKAKITEAMVDNTSLYKRDDGKSVLSVNAIFADTDTTTLTTLAQTDVKNEFNANKLASYGLPKDAVSFDLGQEQENQDSFASLALAFPIVLFVIYILLAIQFRSLLQPLLIFLAIPFSLFGVTLGLFLTDNSFSFFAMLGFFALIGLSIKNTILLTDYANQSRRAGMSPVDAAVAALGERFRPLVATSLTAIVSLIPLAVTNPFWQGLAVVLIFGLASSTLLVLTVFPYYYLGAEYLRIKSGRLARRAFRRRAI
jgi:multidrug efflux pump subunit AcrB